MRIKLKWKEDLESAVYYTRWENVGNGAFNASVSQDPDGRWQFIISGGVPGTIVTLQNKRDRTYKTHSLARRRVVQLAEDYNLFSDNCIPR